MAVQRGNAASIMVTLGPQKKLDDYFDILVPKLSKHWLIEKLTRKVHIASIHERKKALSNLLFT